MNDSFSASAGPAPQAGDVVMTFESRFAVRYAVRQLPDSAQFSASTKEAVQLARSSAEKQAVDIWYAEGESRRLLEASGEPLASRTTCPSGVLTSVVAFGASNTAHQPDRRGRQLLVLVVAPGKPR